MKIQAITVSVNYSDFLKYSIETNKEFFDDWFIVTDTKDKETKELCDKHGLHCIQTDIFYEGGYFRKYAGINEALKLVDKDAWVLFLDGDILLSPLTKRVLTKLNLQKDTIYGIDRVNCYGFERFIEFKKSSGVLKENWLLHGAGLEFGARIVHIFGEDGENGLFTGYKPLGFFQLVHRSSFDYYPEGSLDASHGDIAFAKLYHRDKRQLIPEILGVHICTEKYKSMNWKGRKSDPFQYSINTKWYKKLYDNFIIWLQSLCQPNYYNKQSLICKIIKRIKNITCQ
jgi:hypothetical protein